METDKPADILSLWWISKRCSGRFFIFILDFSMKWGSWLIRCFCSGQDRAGELIEMETVKYLMRIISVVLWSSGAVFLLSPSWSVCSLMRTICCLFVRSSHTLVLYEEATLQRVKTVTTFTRCQTAKISSLKNSEYFWSRLKPRRLTLYILFFNLNALPPSVCLLCADLYPLALSVTTSRDLLDQ